MAKLYKPDGTMQEVEPLDKVVFTVDEINGYIGGYIDAITLNRTEVLYHNEDGFSQNLPYNQKATLLVHAYRSEHKYTRIYGTAIVASLEETGDSQPQ